MATTTAGPSTGEAEDVLRFWFGELDEDGRAPAENRTRWWRKDASFDQLIRDRFADLHAAVAGGQREEWLASARGRLAAVIVLDQFSRNLFRGSGRAHAADARARELVQDGIARGLDRQLAHDERAFFYMPLMHSESLADQDRCVELFSAWRDEVGDALREHVASMLTYAEKHRAIVQRFGRFPHRNALLGRDSTPEELAFLAEPGSSF